MNELERQANEPQPEVVTLADDNCTLELMELGGDARKITFKRGTKLGKVIEAAGVNPAGKTVQMNARNITDPNNEEAEPDSYVTIVGEVHNG